MAGNADITCEGRGGAEQSIGVVPSLQVRHRSLSKTSNERSWIDAKLEAVDSRKESDSNVEETTTVSSDEEAGSLQHIAF